VDKTIQTARVKGYFLDAARELIRGEGVAVVTARNVAEKAGYSYATLYNYFKDIRDLIFCCMEDFMKECRDFVASNTRDDMRGEDLLRATVWGYVKFFIQYPGIFDILFEQKPATVSTKNSELAEVGAFFDSLCGEAWLQCMKSRKPPRQAEPARRANLSYAVHGMLMVYLNRRADLDFAHVKDAVDRIVDAAVG
jgi:AcrR family transcriptional regulator